MARHKLWGLPEGHRMKCMMLSLSLLICVAVLGCLPCFAGEESVILYQPDIVGVDRLFMVALTAPLDAPEIRVTHTEDVLLLDQTPVPARSKIRKYYFKALRPTPRTDILLEHPRGTQTVSIGIWSFEDLREFRELKGVQLPRRWPLGEVLPELKSSQTITSEAVKKEAKAKGVAQEHWLKMSDDEIWALQPDSTIPRWHWVNITAGCPVHGTEVYAGRPYYPWMNEDGGMLRDYHAPMPYTWKIQCPVGKELYPSNDFASGDMSSGAFSDDGIGGGCEIKGPKYGFIAERCQAYCHQMLWVPIECADSFLATGDERYVHKSLVALCRLAVEYAYLATMTQHRHRNSQSQVERLGQAPFSEGPCLSRSGFTVYCIDQPGYQHRMAEAYDRIWPSIDNDQEILPFLQAKGFRVQTHQDVRRFLEENLFAVWMQGSMDGATASNEPYSQWGLVRMAEMLNYERGGDFLDWLFEGSGQMRIFLANGYFRDGSPYESTGGYNGMHVVALGPIVEAVEHLRAMRPSHVPEDKYPNLSKSRRYHHVFDFSMNTVNIDRTYPRVGDGGGHPQFVKLPQRSWQNGGTEAFEHAYKIFKDPKFAWALVHTPDWRPSLEFPYTREEIEREAAQWPDTWNDASVLQDGYGLAMLRSGKRDAKRSFWMMFGRARGHTHDDILHIGLDAFGSEILGHMGYPRNWNYWEHCWTTQIVARQIPFVDMTATPQLFTEAGPVHLAEALAQGFVDEVDEGKAPRVLEEEWQRRTLALIDVDDTSFYVVDLYRIQGGQEIWWSFHAQEDEGFVTQGLDLKKQEHGTLAGPGVPYGDSQWLKKHGCTLNSSYGWQGPMFAFPHLYNVARDEPRESWSADWALKGANGLHFRLTVPETSGSEVSVCDGKSPAGASPYEMKWVLLHRTGQTPARMEVSSFMELYKDQPVIRSVRPVQWTAKRNRESQVGVWAVDLGDRVDTLFASTDASVLIEAEGGFSFAGRFGLYSEKQGVPVYQVLVAGTRLLRNGTGINQKTGEYRGKIVAVDRSKDTVTLSQDPGDLEAMKGQVVFVTNSVRRIGLKVLECSKVPEGVCLRLEFDAKIGTGRTLGIEKHKILTDTPFPLQGYRYYHGARLVNQEGSSEFRVAGIQSTQYVLIDPEAHPRLDQDSLEKAFPKGSWFGVYDYGVGDEVVWPRVFIGPGVQKESSGETDL